MSKINTFKIAKITLILLLCLSTSACISTLVGAVVDTTIAVVKIPFKVGAAVIDVATDDDFTDVANESVKNDDNFESDAQAIKMESMEFE